MSNTLLVVVVLVCAIGGIGAVAYFLDKRSKKSNLPAADLPEPGSKGKAMLWIIRVMVVLMVFSIIGFFVFRSRSFLVAAGIILGIYVIIGYIFRITRLLGK